jgi:hypothetical protein
VPKFLNQSKMAQCIYLPSKFSAWLERRVIDIGHSIEVNDPRDIALLRGLDVFVEVPDDQPTRDYRRSRMSL